MSTIDLHIHSAYSDGADSPIEILDKAKSLGVKNISITDHDTIKALKEASSYSKNLGINYINGVELSTYSCMEVHILGYGFDVNNDKLNSSLEDFAIKRRERVKKIIDALAKYRIFIDEDELPDTQSIGRLHIANLMFNKGYVSSIPEAFDKYLGMRGCTYFPSNRITPFEGVKLIKEAGGIPVIAHPLRFLQNKTLEDLVIGLKQVGLGGIETYYNTHDEATCKKIYDIAQKHKLIATGGTDYHGKNRNIELASVEWKPDKYTIKALRLK